MNRLILVAVAVLIMAIPAFGAEKVLEWDAPTTNADGTPLTDLAGFKIYEHVLTDFNEVAVISADQTSTALDIISGVHCYVATAYDTNGNESLHSNEICVDVLAPKSFELRLRVQ